KGAKPQAAADSRPRLGVLMAAPRTPRLAGALLLLPVAYGAALLAFSAWAYRHGAVHAGAALGYGLTGAGFVAAFLLARRLPPGVRARLAVLTVATGAAAFVCDAALAYVYVRADVVRLRAE